LTNEFGKGYSLRNLEQIRKFYLTYSISSTLMTNLNIKKTQTLSAELIHKNTQSLSAFSEKSETLSRIFKLTWSHYSFLMRIDDEKERHFYEIESERYNWSVRELKRQYVGPRFYFCCKTKQNYF
jgi:hypothetical protein